MSEAEMMPKPTPEHDRIQKLVGTWKVSCTFFMDPSQPPMQCDAVETFEAVGPFFVISRYETSFMGAPFVGRSTLGYDPHQEKWVTTWVDCMSPVLFQLSGREEKGVVVMRGNAWSCRANAVAAQRITHRPLNADEWVCEMFETPPGGAESKTMECRYRRA